MAIIIIKYKRFVVRWSTITAFKKVRINIILKIRLLGEAICKYSEQTKSEFNPINIENT